MLLKPMRYKDYTWPHNPESCAVEYRRQIAAHKIPLGGWYLQDLGRTYRIFRGEGTFAGERAYEEFQTLAEVFDQTGPGLLVHPVWRTERAYFVLLSVTEEPRPDYVRYRFVFWEDMGGCDGSLTERSGTGAVLLPVEETAGDASGGTYTVKRGDTLWGIAKRFGVNLTALIAANPQIKNPNLIYPGNEVRLP